jgi:hypothetical protein
VRIRALLAALLLAVAIGVIVERDVPIGSEICRSLDPETNWFLWWLNGCEKDAGGGGGSGAGA